MKRRLIPLIAACLLCVIGYSAGATLHQRRSQDAFPPMPCVGCEVVGQLLRDKTEYSKACEDEWGKEYNLRYYVGRCVTYKCDQGYYYSFDGWYALPLYQCTNQVINDPDTCPRHSCIYIPLVSELVGITPREVAKFNRSAMALK